MGPAVVAGHDLEILVPRAAVAVFLLDTGIREPDVPIVVRQIEFTRPPCNLLGLTVRPAVAVLLAAIALAEESLIVALQLVVEDDAPNPSALAAETLLGTLVGAIDLGVVRQLARFSDAGVEGLAGLVGAVVTLGPVGLEQVTSAVRQRHGAIVRAERARPNQSLAFEMSSTPTRTVGFVAQVVQIGLGHNPKGAENGQHATLGAVDLVDTVALARLNDAERDSNSLDSRFDLAYSAAHALCLAALRHHGFRSSKRYIVFQVLPDTLGLTSHAPDGAL